MKCELLILTTRQNFVWTSMEEIIPFIESSWKKMATSKSISYEIINIDEVSVKEIFLKAMTCKKIIITAFNAQMAQVMLTIRKKFSLDTPFVFYLHGFSSLACWPLADWDLTSLFTGKDCFISTASRDVEQFKVSSDHKVFLVPFSMDDPITNEEKKKKGEVNRFYYVGRISEQKNLHSLIYALYLAKEINPTIKMSLDIFGKYDELGSPNMGKRGIGYEQSLLELIKTLDLEKNIEMHGFVKREDIRAKIAPGKKIYISASLHSDENFGMSALRSLINGHQVVLSDWGGFSDYKEHFPNQTRLVKTEISEKGPILCPHNLANIINDLSTRPVNEIESKLPDYYGLKEISEKLEKIFLFSGIELNEGFNQNPKLLAHQRKEFSSEIEDEEKKKIHCQIFSSYFDKKNKEIMGAYASQTSRSKRPEKGSLFKLPPWVNVLENTIELFDHHRGIESYKRRPGEEIDILSYCGKKIKISYEDLDVLWNHGYIFEVNVI